MSVEEVDQKDERFFNLLSDPWILVRNNLGEIEELSILEAFRRAHELDCLEGELPTQNVAILRFLLAILYAVFTRVDEKGAPSVLEDLDLAEQRDVALGRWKALWDMPELPMQPIQQYLDYYQDSFWLIHPEKPFYQVSGLRSSNETKDTSQMVSDIPPRLERRFFSLRNGVDAIELSFSEAVRWLINLHAWDYAGKKAVTTDPLGNRGSENGGGTGWLGKLGVLYIKEESLAKTLLMNLVFLNSKEELLAYGLPIWEDQFRNKRTACKLDKRPEGFVELLTHQSRRVFLSTHQGRVNGVTISYGDVFEKDNTLVEQMSSWHVSSLSKTVPILIPSTHKAGRSLWRDLPSLLPQVAGEKQEIVAGVIGWSRILKNNGYVDGSISLVSVGIEYGAMQGVVSNLISDGLTINADLLSHLNQAWVNRILSALDKTDDCIKQFGRLAQQFAQASGGSDGKSEKSAAYDLAYFTFDAKFRNWLASLSPGVDDLEERVIEWQNDASRTIYQLGQDLYETLSPQAIIGQRGLQDSKIVAAPVAYLFFRKGIVKIMKSWKEESDEQS